MLHPLPHNDYLSYCSVAVAAGVAAAGLISALLSSSSADDANETNQRNFKEAMDFNKYQYEDSKYYNSALAQRLRAKQAGYNPLLAMSGLTSSNQTVSTPETNTQSPIDYSQGMSGVSNLANALTENDVSDSVKSANYAGAAKSHQESIGQSIDNDFRRLYNPRALRKLGFDTDVSEQNSKLLRGTLSSRILQENEEVTKRQLMNEQLGLQNDAIQINNGFLSTENWARISETLAREKYYLASGQATIVQANAAMKSAEAAVIESMKQQGIIVTPEESKKLHSLIFDNMTSTSESNFSNAYKNYLTPVGRVGATGVELPHWVGSQRSSRIAKRN